MLKNLLTAAVIVIISPALVLADDIFFAFGQGAAASNTSTTTTAAGSGSVYIYSDANLDFVAADLEFTNSDSSVVQFTSGTVRNSVFNTVGGRKFDDPTNLIINTATDGAVLLAGISENGVNPPLGVLFDPDYDAAVDVSGTDGAFLLARVDYDIVGQGTVNFDLQIDPTNGVIDLVPNPDPDASGPLTVELNPSLGSATLTVGPAVGVPEPSTLTLLMLGSVGLVARRKRA